LSALAWQDLAEDVASSPDSYIDERDRRRLLAFTRRMFPNYEDAVHIDTLTAELERAARTPGSRLIVTMPPRHSKSLNVSEHLPAWYLGNWPDKRIIAASHTARLANTFSRRVRNKFAHPRWPFSGVRIAGDKAAVEAWDVDGRLGGYFAVGVGGAPTGVGGDLVVIDDPLRSAEDADSATIRESLYEWYQGTLRTRLEPGGSIVLTATRWHADDLTGRLLAEQATGGEAWRHVHMPAISDDGEALWPDRWPLAALAQIKAAVGSRVFEAQFQGRPSPAEGGTFKRDWWQRYRALPPLARVEVFVDSAFKDGVANDFSVFATWGTDGLGNYYVIDVWRDRVQYPDLIRAGHDVWAKHRDRAAAVPLNVEDKASGQSAIQTWSRPLPTLSGATLPALPVIPFPVAAGQSKQARAEGVSPIVEARRVYLPEDAPWVDDFVEEHAGFPTGKHDDMVDTTGMALARLAGPVAPSWSDLVGDSWAAFVNGGA
jgi:predicted phage terminase large subunit-like protein